MDYRLERRLHHRNGTIGGVLSESRTRHFINDRRMMAALESEDPAAAVRELLDEAWNKGMSAGQMKERLSRVSGHSPVF